MIREGLVLLLFLAPVAGAHDLASDWGEYKHDAYRSGAGTNLGPSSPTLRWSKMLDDAGMGSPVVAGGRVFVGSVRGNLTAYDAATGDKLWQTHLANRVSTTPVVVGDVVYAAAGGGYPDGNLKRKVHALRVDNGSEIRNFEVGDRNVEAAPLVVDGVLYVATQATQSSNLFAYDVETGAKLWEKDVGNVTTSLAYASGRLFTTERWGDKAKIRSLSAETGALLWEAAPSASSYSGTPLLYNGVLCVGATDREDHNVYALDAADGSVLWIFGTGGNVHSGPSAWNGIVYFGSEDKNVYAVDAKTGQEKWRASTGDAVGASPSVAAGVVYVGSVDMRMYAFDATTGQARLGWPYLATSAITSTVPVAKGTLYFFTADPDRKIVALGSDPGPHGANAPPIIALPSPTNDATGVSRTPTLQWTATDPDPGDALTHMVYFGRTNPPPLAVNGLTTASWRPWDAHEETTDFKLADQATYFWRVVATDSHGASASTDVMRFNTGNEVVPTTTRPTPTPTSPSPTVVDLVAEPDGKNGIPGAQAEAVLLGVLAALAFLARRRA